MAIYQSIRRLPQRSAISPEQAHGRRAHWLLELVTHEDLANPRTYRYAVDFVEVETAGGDVLTFREGLADLEVTQGEGLPALGIEISAMPDNKPWAFHVARGLDLQACRAVLMRWYEGTTYDAALVVAQGRVTSPAWGDAASPLRFTLQSDAVDSQATVPPEAAQVNPTTWPMTTSPVTMYAPEQGNGAYYPRVYGYPGRNGGPYIAAAADRIDVHASPAVMLEQGGSSALARTYGKLCIADTPVLATTALVRDLSAGYMERPYSRMQETVPVRTMVDGRGRLVSYVLQSDFTRLNLQDGNSYAVAWESGGGVANDTGTAPIRGAGEVIAHMLQECSVPVNRGRMIAARRRLDRFALDFSISTPTKPRDWIERELSGILPVFLRWSAAGIWYELPPYDATEKDVVGHLVADDADTSAGLLVTRDGDVTMGDASQVANDITLRYGREYGAGLHKSRRITYKQPADLEADEYASTHCAQSASRYGVRPRVIETDLVYDDATAAALLQLYAMWWALPRRQLRYVGGTVLDRLEPGDVVTITDSEQYLHGVLAWVRSVSMSLSQTAVEVELLEQPNVRALEGT